MTSHYMFLPSGFPSLPLKNGIGRTVCQLKRVTIKFCKSSGTSSGVRHWIEQDMLEFAKSNPEVVVYLKPRRHHAPVVISEYLNGERHYTNMHNFTRDAVSKWLTFFRTRVGLQTIRFRKVHHTSIPSIQGVWHPFVNKDPELNITTFPCAKLSQPAHMPESATERLRAMFERHKITEQIEENLGDHVKIDVQR